MHNSLNGVSLFLLAHSVFDKNASILGNFYNTDTVIFRELPEDFLQNIFSNMEMIDQNKCLHKISLRNERSW